MFLEHSTWHKIRETGCPAGVTAVCPSGGIQAAPKGQDHPSLKMVHKRQEVTCQSWRQDPGIEHQVKLQTLSSFDALRRSSSRSKSRHCHLLHALYHKLFYCIIFFLITILSNKYYYAHVETQENQRHIPSPGFKVKSVQSQNPHLLYHFSLQTHHRTIGCFQQLPKGSTLAPKMDCFSPTLTVPRESPTPEFQTCTIFTNEKVVLQRYKGKVNNTIPILYHMHNISEVVILMFHILPSD